MNEFEQQLSYIGINALIKADKVDKNVIYIEASNQSSDTQDEIVLQKALKDEAEKFLKRGVISWNHLHKIQNDPKYICGEPLDVRFPSDGATLVKAKIYPNNEYGKTILSLANDESTRLGASVGGAILKRAKSFDQALQKSIKYIVKVIWDEVAVTHQPVNESTLGSVSVIPFGDFAKSFIFDDVERGEALAKALSAGYGTNAATMTGGTALIQESLMGANKKKKQKHINDAFKIVIANLKKGKVNDYKDLYNLMKSIGMEVFTPIFAKTIVQNITKLKF